MLFTDGQQRTTKLSVSAVIALTLTLDCHSNVFYASVIVNKMTFLACFVSFISCVVL